MKLLLYNALSAAFGFDIWATTTYKQGFAHNFWHEIYTRKCSAV